MKKLLVVVDYQNDFVFGALANSAAVSLESGIANLCRQTLDEGGFVLFTLDTHGEGYLKTREGEHLPIPHCIENTDGWQLMRELRRFDGKPRTAIINKATFGSAEIANAAFELCGGKPDEINICGVVTDICVISNAIILHSAFLDAKCILHKNLCAATTRENHENAVKILVGMGWEAV